mgnify:CR=1 FL=1
MGAGYKKGELEGDWATFARIAGPFVNQVPLQDQEDHLHDMLVEMEKVKRKYEAKGKPLTEAGLMLVARYELLGYWDKRRYRLFALNCTHCSSEQRHECRDAMKQPSECPKGKGHQVLSLDRIPKDGDGNKDGLVGLIPDGKQVDLDAKLDARSELKRMPKWVVKLGYRKYAGYRLGKSNYIKLKEFAQKWNEEP